MRRAGTPIASIAASRNWTRARTRCSPSSGSGRTSIGQALAFGKTPLDLLRGTGGEEKVLKNAKDAAATEALEIATYTAIERLARSVGDDDTADLAKSILADEERMLARVLREIPKLTDAVARAELKDDPSYDVTKTGAADAIREAGEATARRRPHDRRDDQARGPSGAQGPRRRSGRGPDQGSGRRRGGPGDLWL